MTQRSAYVTDLRTLQSECTANYIRLTRLLGALACLKGPVEALEGPSMASSLRPSICTSWRFARDEYFYLPK